MSEIQTKINRFVSFAAALRKHGKPNILVYFGYALGDDLLCSAVLHGLKRMGNDKIWMMSNFPYMFVGNTDVEAVIPVNTRFLSIAARLGVRIITPGYTDMLPDGDRQIPPDKHILVKLCESAQVTGKFSVKPYIGPIEIYPLPPDPRPTISIQSSGVAASWHITTKDWFPERFQKVVDALADDFRFVQVGSAKDPELVGTLDMRGKTSIRETAGVLKASRLYVGQVGFLMHLARSVNCRSVIVYGGREHPDQSGYPCNENVYSAVECSPCWLLSECKVGKICMDNISVEIVTEAIKRTYDRGTANLELDVADL